MHMHKVFSANRAVLCLDGTHCSALGLHVCLRVPQFLFRLSCRADTPQTHRPTRIHKHNKQWRLSSSSFIPRPKHTRTHAVTQMHPYTHKNSLSLRNANAKKSECCPVWDKWTETPFISLIYCVKSTLRLHCVHRLVSYTCPWTPFVHGLAGVLTSLLTHYLHIVFERK